MESINKITTHFIIKYMWLLGGVTILFLLVSTLSLRQCLFSVFLIMFCVCFINPTMFRSMHLIL